MTPTITAQIMHVDLCIKRFIMLENVCVPPPLKCRTLTRSTSMTPASLLWALR